MIKKGISAIIMADNDSNYFLILHRNSNWTGWEFLKGRIEDGESAEEALIREITEKTSLNKIKIKKTLGFQKSFRYENDLHVFDVYLVEANMNIPVKVNPEVHDNFLWAPQSRILELLKWENEKEIFSKMIKIV